MPRTNKFDRDRISKLFGERTKPIQKDDEIKMFMKPTKMFPKQEAMKKQPTQAQIVRKEDQSTKAFKSFNYITMNKVFNVQHQGQQIQKLNFRCYNDAEIFGDDYIEFLKKNHDQDHDTPPEQVRFDISVGIKRLKQGIDTNTAPQNDCASSVRSHGSKGLLRYESVREKSLFDQRQ